MGKNCFPNVFIQIFRLLLKILLWWWIHLRKIKQIQLNDKNYQQYDQKKY